MNGTGKLPPPSTTSFGAADVSIANLNTSVVCLLSEKTLLSLIKPCRMSSAAARESFRSCKLDSNSGTRAQAEPRAAPVVTRRSYCAALRLRAPQSRTRNSLAQPCVSAYHLMFVTLYNSAPHQRGRESANRKHSSLRCGRITTEAM